MYDFAHPIQDAIEGITHSLCSLEYEDHRPLYNWVIEHVDVPHTPRQIEFARLNVTHTVMSKRYLRSLVERELVDGWDDPRMPTLCGLRRRGFTADSVLDFINRVGVAKSNSLVDIGLLEHCAREDLNMKAHRRVAVLDPVKVIIENIPEGEVRYFDLPNNPNDPEAGYRKVALTREIYIERDDVSSDPPPKYFRMKKDAEVRLMGAYIVRCTDIVCDEEGKVTLARCTADIETGAGVPADGRKVKGTIHWVSAEKNLPIKVRLYDRLFTNADMNEIPSAEYENYLNPDSLVTLESCFAEESLGDAKAGDRFQFVRLGYFTPDTKCPDVFNRTVTLKDSFKAK